MLNAVCLQNSACNKMETPRKRKREFQNETQTIGNDFSKNTQRNATKRTKRIIEDISFEERGVDVRNASPRITKSNFHRRLSLRSSRRSLRGLANALGMKTSSSPVSSKPPHLSLPKTPQSRLARGAALRRSDSFVRLRKPLVSLRGSMRLKLQSQIKRSMMKGKTDYSLPIIGQNGEMDYLRFMSALKKNEMKEDHKDVKYANSTQ